MFTTTYTWITITTKNVVLDKPKPVALLMVCMRTAAAQEKKKIENAMLLPTENCITNLVTAEFWASGPCPIFTYRWLP